MAVLTNTEIIRRLRNLKNWKVVNNSIENEFLFPDFLTAIKFVNSLSEVAEQLNHHPDILIHSWNKVKLNISTHSEGGITDKDFLLAEKIEKIIND